MSAKSRTTLAAELTVAVNDNTSGDITPSDVRGVVMDTNDSALNKVDETTAFSLTLLDDANAATARGTLGLGNSATLNVGTSAGTVAAGNHTHTSLSLTSLILRASNGTDVTLYIDYDQGVYTLRVGQPT